MNEGEKDLNAYLARIRKTVEDSKRLVSQVGLRIAETDRMLEKQGLSREQVMAMRFTEAQVEAVNAELKRRGMDPLEGWGLGARTEAPDESDALRPEPDVPASNDEFAERQRKFGLMMKPFQI